MTAIEWTHKPGYKGETWNPVVGCSVVSPGCTNCYAMRQAARLLDGNPKTPHYAGTTMPTKAGAVWSGKIAKAPDAIFLKPLRWRAPRCIFVNSMGDLFHERVQDALIDQVFAVMALAPQHLFLVLTKRAERMRDYFTDLFRSAPFDDRKQAVTGAAFNLCDELSRGKNERAFTDAECLLNDRWPLPNCWLGVSAEDQTRADERVPLLLATPAAKRFVSAEPLLGPIDLRSIWTHCPTHDFESGFCVGQCPDMRRLDWIIAGGESGHDARPAHPDWFRAIRDQCSGAGVPFFMKQITECGNKTPLADWPDDLQVREWPE